MTLTEEIKDFAVSKMGITMVGIAPVGRFSDAPSGKRPEDILPGAKSVIVLGVRLLDGAMQAIFRKFEEGKRNAHGLYATYASTIAPNLQMGQAIYSLSNYIEQKTGEAAVPTTAGPFQATSSFSQRRAAVAAGLGEYGWSGAVLNPKYGPRMFFCSIITTLELDYDDMYSGPRLCDPNKCRVCIDRCPVHAISEYPEGVETKVGDKKEVYCKLNRPLCKAARFGLVKETATQTGAHNSEHNKAFVSSECVTEEEFLDGISKLEKSLSGLQLYPNWKCSLCLAYCPVGNWKERFEDTGLSKGSYSQDVKQEARIQRDVLT